jgi:membrane fusion protein, heavy metal efflux system
VPLRLWRKLWGGRLIRDATKTLVVFCAALLLFSCQKNESQDEKNPTAVPEVTIAKVERGPISQDLIVTGNLAALPNRDAKVAALTPGRVLKLLVSEGDPVHEGQPLVEIDSTLLREQERQAEATVAQAKASADNARLNAEREEGLLGRGISSRKEVEDARTQLQVNTATLAQAEAGLAAIKVQVARSVLRSPIAGTVIKRFVGVGEQVDGTAAQPIIQVAQINPLELIGQVPAMRLAEIRVGESFSFETNAVAGSKFTARVASILPAVDPATNNGTVRIRVENAKRNLKLGQFLSIILPLKQTGARLSVPVQSVYPNETGETQVYKVIGDEAEAVPVKIGVQSNGRAEILEGVSEGDTIIVKGGYGLPEKAKVQVKR